MQGGWVGDLVRISFGGKARLVSTTGVTTGQPALCSVHCCCCWSPKFGKSGDVGLPALVASLMQLHSWPDPTIQESAVIYKIKFLPFLCCKLYSKPVYPSKQFSCRKSIMRLKLSSPESRRKLRAQAN